MVLNYKLILRIIGLITIVIAAAMMPALLVSAIYKEVDALWAFLITIIPMFIIGMIIVFGVRPASYHIKIRDGFAIVSICWILSSVLGAVPFMLSGYIPNFADAFFETSSGFSTTGASILTDVEALPKGLLFWRSFTHWLGGMGILVFALAFLPALGISGNRIADAETTGPTLDKVSPKMHDTAKILYKIYIGFTLAHVVLLLLGNVSLFDSLTHAFGSIGTGGFSTYSDSVAHFNSPYVEIVITVFMTLAGTNFGLYYFLFKGDFREFFGDSEFRAYIFILFGVAILIAGNLWFTGTYDSMGRSFLYSIFQCSSVMTTTGYATANFDLWPSFSKTLLLGLMFIGGCSASTAGGIKVIRLIVLLKMIKRGIIMRLHPQAVIHIKINKRTLSADTASLIASFFFLYIGLLVLGTLIVSVENFDLVTSFTAVVACIGNIGPGFSLVGPAMNFSIFSNFTKIFLSFVMIAGRLELFTVFLLFSPQFWNQDK